MSARPIILGLAGAIGAGKSTAAAILAERHGFGRTRFAGPLKAMLRAFLAAVGVPAETIERMIEGDLKEVPSPLLGGRSPRYAMQTLGTEWGRDLMAANLWTSAWRASVDAALAAGARGVAIEDCRFPNEAEVIRRHGGIVVRIERHGLADASGHVSEMSLIEPDAVVRNHGSIDDLADRLGQLLCGMRG